MAGRVCALLEATSFGRELTIFQHPAARGGGGTGGEFSQEGTPSNGLSKSRALVPRAVTPRIATTRVATPRVVPPTLHEESRATAVRPERAAKTGAADAFVAGGGVDAVRVDGVAGLAAIKLSQHVPGYWLLGYFVVVSVLAFIFCASDKRQAKDRQWRTPEKFLHFF